MNAVWNSYGQLCGCPEIFKKSCKFFCRELDIRVAQVVETDTLHLVCYQKIWEMLAQEIGPNPLSHRVYIKNTAWSTDIQ